MAKNDAKPTKPRPLNVYLDQSLYGHFLNQGNGDWRKNDVAALLLQAQAKNVAQVWASPTHVLETIQATDLVRRGKLAGAILELINARRMWHGNELETLRHFADFLKICAPSFIRYPEFFKERVLTTRRIWLGALALIAATDKLQLEPLINSLVKVKTTSRLIHARFAVNPGKWVDEMIENVNQQRTTTGNPFAEFDAMTLQQMETEIASLEPQFTKLTKRDLMRLNKERANLARAYGALEIGKMLQAVFTLPCEMELTFDIPHLVECWPALQKMTGCAALPSNVTSADKYALMGDASLVRIVLQQAIFAVAKVGLVPSTVSFDVIFRELQRCINDRRIPTGGLTFDASHASALVWCDVFVSRDAGLTESAKTMANLIEKQTKGVRRVEVVATAEQLRKCLERKNGGTYQSHEVSVELNDWGSA